MKKLGYLIRVMHKNKSKYPPLCRLEVLVVVVDDHRIG